jgi:hypothetical protein
VIRQRHAPRGPLHELHAEARLGPRDRLADRGRRQREALAGGRERAEIGDGDEDLERMRGVLSDRLADVEAQKDVAFSTDFPTGT